MDKECSGGRTSAEVTRSIWITLRNTAESGVSAGALEFFLRTEVPEGATAPASLLISWPPMPRGMAPAPEEFAEAMTERAAPKPR